jgi:hypothetical protein
VWLTAFGEGHVRSFARSFLSMSPTAHTNDKCSTLPSEAVRVRDNKISSFDLERSYALIHTYNLTRYV